MNVLSLFDGMSCGQIALERADIKVNKYYASEIKNHAIQVTQHNYPNTIQIGDVAKIKAKDLSIIDLLIGGSPCQDFSSQNKKREGLTGDKSNLFFEYLRLWEEIKIINPKAKFLLENVMMLPEHYAALSNYMDTYPVEINGALVSAANRRRLFWTNIGPYYSDLFGFRHCDIPQPKDKNILFQDILTEGYTDLIKANGLKTSDSISFKDWEKAKKRYDKQFENIIFTTSDYDFKKGYRALNKIELERLHNIPEGYTNILGVKKAHDLIGDGWTVDVIAHIFSFLSK